MRAMTKDYSASGNSSEFPRSILIIGETRRDEQQGGTINLIETNKDNYFYFALSDIDDGDVIDGSTNTSKLRESSKRRSTRRDEDSSSRRVSQTAD